MRTIIAGSRDCHDFSILQKAIAASEFVITIVLSGHARGVDLLGERWAKENGITLETYPALWNRFGNSAGTIRNRVMAESAEALIAIWDGRSPGTKHMIQIARNKSLKVFVYMI